MIFTLIRSTQSLKKKLIVSIKSKPWHWFVAVFLTVAAGFLRFYNIAHTLMFLGDQGRDALIVSRIFKELDPVFIGPITSVGNMYLGPLYYYFMLPFLWLSYPSPLGPVYAVAFFSTASVWLMYLLGKKMFTPLTGLFASFFLGFGYFAIEISRFSWNPNLAPLVSLLIMYFTWKAMKQPKYWLAATGAFCAIIQLHYMALLAGGSLFMLWLVSLIHNIKVIIVVNQNQSKIKHELVKMLANHLKICVGCFAIFFISILPQVLFDLKHKGLNLKALVGMFSQEKILVGENSSNLLSFIQRLAGNIQSRTVTILLRLNIGNLPRFELWIVGFVIFFLIFILIYHLKKTKDARNILVLFSFLLIGIMGTAAYQHSLFNHYIAYLLPASCFALALPLSLLIKKHKLLGTLVSSATLLGYLLINQPQWPLQPNNLYFRTIETSNFISKKIKASDYYDLVLLSETKDHYAQGYRYFLSTTDHPPHDKKSPTEPNTLIIIDEEKYNRDIIRLPIYDIQTFASQEIDEKFYNDELPDIYILRAD